jgi:hypothetical protein
MIEFKLVMALIPDGVRLSAEDLQDYCMELTHEEAKELRDWLIKQYPLDV